MHPCLSCETPTDNPTYCSRSCAAKINNRLYKKRNKTSQCDPCVVCGSLCKRPLQDTCSNLCRRIKSILDGTARVRVLKLTKLEIEGAICTICHRTDWEGVPIPLVLDHIDGDSTNNSWDNLRLVCGNCDMLLPTYKGRNKGSGRYARAQRYQEGKSY
jgi:hypothetical protein